MIPEVLRVLSGARMDLSSEVLLKRDMADIFKRHGFKFQAEYVLDKANRPDFYYDGVAIEVKIKGAAKSIYKQCERYCQFETVRALILVTNKAMGFPKEISGKPCYVVNVGRGWL